MRRQSRFEAFDALFQLLDAGEGFLFDFPHPPPRGFDIPVCFDDRAERPPDFRFEMVAGIADFLFQFNANRFDPVFELVEPDFKRCDPCFEDVASRNEFRVQLIKAVVELIKST